MLPGLVGAVLSVILASSFLYQTAIRGNYLKALGYLAIAAVTGFLVGRMLILQITDGVI